MVIYITLTVALVALAAHVILARAQARAREVERAHSIVPPPPSPVAIDAAPKTKASSRLPPGTRTITVPSRPHAHPPVVLCLALAALAGCPRLPHISGCTPLSSRCQGDRPQVCSPSQRWHYDGDERCDVTPGQTCKVSSQGVAGCAR